MHFSFWGFTSVCVCVRARKCVWTSETEKLAVSVDFSGTLQSGQNIRIETETLNEAKKSSIRQKGSVGLQNTEGRLAPGDVTNPTWWNVEV